VRGGVCCTLSVGWGRALFCGGGGEDVVLRTHLLLNQERKIHTKLSDDEEDGR